jgi:hypothetical protein
MSGKKQFNGVGRQDPADWENTWGVAHAGHVTGGNNDHLAAGVGVYNGENLDLLHANGQFGMWETAGQTPGAQFGVKGEAQSIGLQASLGDIVGGVGSLFGQDWASDDQQESNLGGWENFLSGEVHGPQAKGEVSFGSDGIYAGGTAELYGASGKVGGAEYDWMGGTELNFSAGAGGVGAEAGLISTDEDGDGLTEWGFQLGGELGIGAGFGMKTELPGHIANAASAGWDWLTGE